MKGLVLALDAAAGPGTIALLRDGAVVAAREVEMRSAAEERYFPAVLETLAAAGVVVHDLAAVVAGAGPGSFTALRVVGAVAKGLCEGAALPLHGVPSLALIVAGHDGTRRAGRWLATLDALRGDRYAALVATGADGAIVSHESLGLIPASDVPERAVALAATPIGPDEALAAHPHARGVARAAALAAAGGPADLASWEPVYGRLAEAQVKWELAHGRPLEAARIAT